VIIDVAGVQFCDAHGLGLLVGTTERLRLAGAELSVRGADAHLYRLFEVTGLLEWLRVEPPAANTALVRDLQRTTTGRHSQSVLDAALGLVVTMAQSVVRGADGASITLARDGAFSTAAASNDTVLNMDHDQYETGEGPCLDAARDGERFQITSLADETRWPLFVPRAQARGIESILSTPLVADEVRLGALNIYSKSVRAFASHETDWADQFASEAALVVLSSKNASAGSVLDAQIVQALLSREVIALAQGVLMEREGLTPEAAHLWLRERSRRTSQPLRDVCEQLVYPKGPLARGTDAGPNG
jgi:hypothetical protein